MTYNPAVKFIDENGVPYGVKHIDNKPRFSSMPYLYDVAEGNVSNHKAFRVLGINLAVPNGTLEDVCIQSANIPLPTAATAMELVGNAVDIGVTIYTSTATAGSATEINDDTQDFTAGSVVAVGDAVLLDDSDALGWVTTVAEAQLTCSAGFYGPDGAVTPGVGENYRVVDVSAGGLGAQVCCVRGLDINYNAISEYVVMNGATPVDPLTYSYYRINHLNVAVTGGNFVATGPIILRGTAGTPIYSQIAAENNIALQALYTVPNGYAGYITDWTGGSSGTKPMSVLLRVAANDQTGQRLQPGAFHTKGSLLVSTGTNQIILPAPIVVPARCSIKCSAMGIGGAGEASASFGMWIETV